MLLTCYVGTMQTAAYYIEQAERAARIASLVTPGSDHAQRKLLKRLQRVGLEFAQAVGSTAIGMTSSGDSRKFPPTMLSSGNNQVDGPAFGREAKKIEEPQGGARPSRFDRSTESGEARAPIALGAR